MTDTGRFVWYELLTSDPGAAIEFYTHVTGWTTQRWATGDYTMFVGSQGPLGGVNALPEAAKQMGASPFWQANIVVTNVDDSVALVRELGGKVFVREDVPTIGALAVVTDPQGAVIALFTPERPMPPHDTSRPGEIAWHELYTSDVDRALAFYERIAGWKQLDSMPLPTGPYVVFGREPREELGGMMKMPPGMTAPDGRPVPPSWVFYIRVDDLPAALTRATDRGARVLLEPMDVPGGQRVAQFLDPQGAAIALIANA